MIFCWNCKDCFSPKFIAICKQFVRSHKPRILILLETWINGEKANKVIRRLGFQFNIQQDAEGFSGGIWILWNDPGFNIQLIFTHRQLIHVFVTFNIFSGFLTAVYSSPVFSQHSVLWNLELLSPLMKKLGLLRAILIRFLARRIS